MNNYYITFGSDTKFPYGKNDYVLVRCHTMNQAYRLFDAVFPPRDGRNISNCAFVYDESEWNESVQKYYKGCEPSAVITVDISRKRDEERCENSIVEKHRNL